MDRYADKAEKAFEDLMDLGFNVEDRNAGHVFSAAQTTVSYTHLTLPTNREV